MSMCTTVLHNKKGFHTHPVLYKFEARNLKTAVCYEFQSLICYIYGLKKVLYLSLCTYDGIQLELRVICVSLHYY